MGFNSNNSLNELLEFEQPLENQIIHIDQTQREPSNLQLICSLTHVEKQAQIVWSYNNSHKLPLAQFNTSFDGKTARLSAKGLKPEHSGSYACEIRLPSGASTAYTQCEVVILKRPLVGSNDPPHPISMPVHSNKEISNGGMKSQESAPSRSSRCEYALSGMTSSRWLNQEEALTVSTEPPKTSPPPAPPLPSPPTLLPSHFMQRRMGDAVRDYDDNDTLPTDNCSTRGSAPKDHSVGLNQHYHSMSTRSDCVSLTPAEYIELRTLSDVPGLPEDEHLEDMDFAYECPRRLRSRSQGRMWRSLAEPRVIFINTTPQADMMYQRCCCACHRYHCMYMGAEGYPLVDELAHLSKGSLSKGSGSKRNNKRISFNPHPEMRSTEGARYGTDGLDSVHISRRTSVDLTKEPVQQTQAVSCSRITQHATVKPPPNCRPDASWTSGPAKYLPKDTEVQSPEAAAAAKATIKRVLESRMCDSVFGRSFDATETKSISKETPTFPISNSKSAKNKVSKEEEDLNQNEDSNSMLVRRNEDVCLPNGEIEAAKQRFLNALARFQMGSSSKPEHDAACHSKGVYKSNGSQECMAVSTEGGRQTRIPSNCAISELNPGAQRPERLTLRNLTRSDVQSNWQQQRNKIFRNIKCTRSPSISKRFSRCEEGDCKEAICYPEEDEKIAVESKKPSTFSPNEFQTAALTDPVAFLNEHFRKYKIAPLTLLEMKNLLLRFVQLNTHEYFKYGVKVTNFSTSWKDGIAMCALLHHFFPNSFDFNTVLSGGKANNYRLAFEIAAEMAGVPDFIGTEEVTRSETGPDWRRIFLYLSHILVALEDHPLNRARPSQLVRTNR